MEKFQPQAASVLELGCFDAKSIPWLPQAPKTYVGLDAGWEGGLALARQQWPEYEFHECGKPQQMSAAVAGRKFDAAVAMETLEHIPPAMLGSCLDELFRALPPEGILLASVPVEIGPMFLAKWAAK